jgi:hypothetical protein
VTGSGFSPRMRFLPASSSAYTHDMSTSLAPADEGRRSPGLSVRLEGQSPAARQVFVDERGVRRRLIRAGERTLAAVVAGVVVIGAGGMLGAPLAPRLRLPLIGLTDPAGSPKASQAADRSSPSDPPAHARGRGPSQPAPARAPGPSAAVRAAGTTTSPPAASPAVATSATHAPIGTEVSSSPPQSSPASKGATGNPAPAPSPSPAPAPSPAPNDHGQTVAAAHSQSRADPSPGPRNSPNSTKAK